MNKVALVGRLTRDPEIRYVQDGMPLVKFGVAVGRRYRKPNEPDADFINCVAFGKTAEFIGKYFSKGKPIGIAGKIQTSSWDDATTGQKRYNTEVIAEEVEFVESKSSADNNQGNNYNNNNYNNNNYNNQNNYNNNNNNYNNNYDNYDNSPNSYYSDPSGNYDNSSNSNNFNGNNNANSQNQNDFYSIDEDVDEQNLPF